MKTRDIRPKFKEWGTERGAILCLEEMNERLRELEKAMTSTTEIIVSITNNMEKLNVINDAMANQVDKLNKMRDDERGVSVHSELADGEDY